MTKDTPNTKPTKTKKPRGNKALPLDWITDTSSAVKAEHSVWIAVITQAMMDALSRSRKPEEQFCKFEATRWLTGNSKDFKDVCSLAGLDPDYVRLKAKKALATGALWRAEAGTGKRYEERKAYRAREKDQKARTMPIHTKSAVAKTAEHIPA